MPGGHPGYRLLLGLARCRTWCTGRAYPHLISLHKSTAHDQKVLSFVMFKKASPNVVIVLISYR